MIFNINSTRGQNAGPHVRSTGNLCNQDNLVRGSEYISVNVQVEFVSRFELLDFCIHILRRPTPTFVIKSGLEN